jgi:hypothetical protein
MIQIKINLSHLNLSNMLLMMLIVQVDLFHIDIEIWLKGWQTRLNEAKEIKWWGGGHLHQGQGWGPHLLTMHQVVVVQESHIELPQTPLENQSSQ